MGLVLFMIFSLEIKARSEERRVGKENRGEWWSGEGKDGIRDGHVTGVQTCALPISVNGDRLLNAFLNKDRTNKIARVQARFPHQIAQCTGPAQATEAKVSRDGTCVVHDLLT